MSRRLISGISLFPSMLRSVPDNSQESGLKAQSPIHHRRGGPAARAGGHERPRQRFVSRTAAKKGGGTDLSRRASMGEAPEPGRRFGCVRIRQVRRRLRRDCARARCFRVKALAYLEPPWCRVTLPELSAGFQQHARDLPRLRSTGQASDDGHDRAANAAGPREPGRLAFQVGEKAPQGGPRQGAPYDPETA
jgi:hypothetical protein